MTLTKNSGSELLDCPNCLGLGEGGRCAWLTVPHCMGRMCAFAQDREGLAGTAGRVQQRLASLDESRQARIAKKYYRGERPWKQQER